MGQSVNAAACNVNVVKDAATVSITKGKTQGTVASRGVLIGVGWLMVMLPPCEPVPLGTRRHEGGRAFLLAVVVVSWLSGVAVATATVVAGCGCCAVALSSSPSPRPPSCTGGAVVMGPLKFIWKLHATFTSAQQSEKGGGD